MQLKTLILLTALLALVSGCEAAPDAQLQTKKNLIRRFTDLTNAADWDGLAEVVAVNFTRHSAATPGPPVTSREQFVALQKGFLRTFPDQHVTIQQLVAEGDRVAILATYSGTQTGPLAQYPATGKRVESPFIGIFRIESGRIAELWVEWDNLAMLTQLGLFPPPGAQPSEQK